MITAASRPHVFLVEDQKRVRGWPVGPALLEALGGINGDVRDALADERARLGEQGYPEDLPLPALWWRVSPSPKKGAAETRVLATAGA